MGNKEPDTLEIESWNFLASAFKSFNFSAVFVGGAEAGKRREEQTDGRPLGFGGQESHV